jgi:hypothetical protein
MITEWEAFEELGYSGRISVGELGFGPGHEVVVCPGPGPGNPAIVKIYDLNGNLLEEWIPESLEGGYGCWPAVRNQKVYLTPGPAPGAEQLVIEMSPQGSLLRKWKLSIPSLQNSLKAVLCVLNLGDDSEENQERLVVWGTAVAQNPSQVFLWSPEENEVIQIETIPTTFGASVTLLSLQNIRTGIAVGPGPLEGYPAWIKVISLEPKPKVVFDIAPYESENSSGVNLAAVDVDNDGIDELIIGEGSRPGRPPIVRVCRTNGEMLAEWKAF